MKRQKGYSLVSVLVATAIVGIALAGVLFVVDLVSSTVARNAATNEVEAAIRTVQSIVAGKELCDNALRGATSSTYVTFNPGNAPYPALPARNEGTIDNIFLQRSNGEAGATRILFTGMTIGLGYRVQRMAIAERVPGQGRGVLNLSGTDYETYAAEIIIEFVNLAGGHTSGMRTRMIPINIVVNRGGDGTARTADDQIVRCYQDSSVQYLCEQLGGTYQNGNCVGVLSDTQADCRAQLNGQAGDCPDNANPNIECNKIYYVAGFNSGGANDSRPQCRCQLVCRQGTTQAGTNTSSTTSTTGVTAAATAATGVGTSGGGN